MLKPLLLIAAALPNPNAVRPRSTARMKFLCKCLISCSLAVGAFQPAAGQTSAGQESIARPVYRDSDQPKDPSPAAKLLHFDNKHRVPGRLFVHFIGAQQIEALVAQGSNVGELPTDKGSAARVAAEIADRVGAKVVSLLVSRRTGKGIIAIFDMSDEQARQVAEDPRVYLIEPDCYAFPAEVKARTQPSGV